jgi:hypothetical protein
VFENRVLRRIFGLKRDEVTGGWRKLHNEELRDLYFSPSVIRMIKYRIMRLAGHIARMGRRSIGTPERKRPLGRPRRRWVINIKMELGDIIWSGHVQRSCECHGGSSAFMKCRETIKWLQLMASRVVLSSI